MYRAAFERLGRRSYYTGINASTTALLLGNIHEARELAREVAKLCRQEIERWPVRHEAKQGYWTLATLGEAHLICGDLEQSVRFYRRAVECAPNDYVKLASTKRQLRALLSHSSTGLHQRAEQPGAPRELASRRKCVARAPRGRSARARPASPSPVLTAR